MERDVSSQCEQLAGLFGIALRRRNVGVGRYANSDGTTRYVRFGRAGEADRTGVLPDGRRLEVEIKRPGERPSALQISRMREVNLTGGVAFWVDDPEQLRAALPRLLEGCRVEIDAEGLPWLTDE